MSTPLVSIGIPVYNGEKYLRRALGALLAQDYENIELIISDNASTDATSRICQEYAAMDTRVGLNVNDHNIGPAANFGLVLQKARGKYFMWAAYDDFWTVGFVSALVKELESHPESSVAMCAIERAHESGATHNVVRHAGPTDPSRMSRLRLALALVAGRLYHFYIYGLYRTAFLEQAYRNYPAVMYNDRLFVCQIALATKFRYVDQVLHVRQLHDKPLNHRYAHDELGRIWNNPYARLKMVLVAGPYLLRSNVILWQHKLWIPLVVIRLAIWNLYGGLQNLLYVVSGKLLGPAGRKTLGQRVCRLLGKKPNKLVAR